MQTALVKLEERQPDFEAILRDIEKDRAAIVMARNGIIGEARAFLRKFGNPVEDDGHPRYYDGRLYAVAEAVISRAG
jgi:hypothetical protein